MELGYLHAVSSGKDVLPERRDGATRGLRGALCARELVHKALPLVAADALVDVAKLRGHQRPGASSQQDDQSSLVCSACVGVGNSSRIIARLASKLVLGPAQRRSKVQSPVNLERPCVTHDRPEVK